jgi:hypothetical protein
MMRLAALPVALLVLTGCVGIQSALGHPPCNATGNAVPAISEAQLRAAWETLMGSPLPERCSAPWSWSVVSQDELAQICGKTLNAAGAWKDANACTIFTVGDNGTRDPGCPVSYTWPKYATSRELNTHEIAHWFAWCARGDADLTHTKFPAIWGPGGYDGMFGP